MSLSLSILVIILLFISNHINSTNHFIDSNECLLDIAILAFGHSYNNEIISSLHSNECEIENIFWITEMTYNSTILETDLNIKRVKIVRENIETKGYTAFLLPLLENNTYSLVIDLDNWSISKENWIDTAIQEVRKPKQVYACDVYNNFDSAIGCLLLLLCYEVFGLIQNFESHLCLQLKKYP